jgi:hypothetical protein
MPGRGLIGKSVQSNRHAGHQGAAEAGRTVYCGFPLRSESRFNAALSR